MVFENENTHIKMKKSDEEANFDSLYESACKEVKQYFKKEYPNMAGKAITEKGKIEDTSPVDESVLATFQSASKESIHSTLSLLKKSYKKWFDLGYLKRAELVLKAADQLSERKFEFAALLAYEHGKNRYEAMGDVDEAIDFMRFYAMNLIENHGFDHLTGKAYENEESRSIMKPYGVFAVIAPFNFFSITVGMTVAPLLVGNAVVLKPSSDIPLVSFLFVELLVKAGVPNDVIAFLAGSGSSVGPALVAHNDVGGILFTGSRETGLDIFRTANKDRPKVVVTEMGGKDCIIVSNEANIDKAVEGVARAAFGYSGQKCSACSVVLVHKDVYDTFQKKLVARTKQIVMGDPKVQITFMGPLINKAAYQKYKDIIPRLQQEGKVLAGAKVADYKGYFAEPTIVEPKSDKSFLLHEELFLPVLAMKRISNLDEGIDFVNSLEYGLTGGIFTENKAEINKYFHNVDVGVIYANRSQGGSTGAMVGSQPFVGWKMSGISGKGTGSFYYLQQFLREQSQTIAH